MFTGLISDIAVVKAFLTKGDTASLMLEICDGKEYVTKGDSVSVNGVCLTATSVDKGNIIFDVSVTTTESSNLAGLRSGDRVNIELALKVDDRFGGHFVLGHVDCTGKIKSIQTLSGDSSRVVTVAVTKDAMPYLIEKGSIAVNGISLTIQHVESSVFRTVIVPHTWRSTTLQYAKTGDSVNIEYDILVKTILHTQRLLSRRDNELTTDKLHDWGY